MSSRLQRELDSVKRQLGARSRLSEDRQREWDGDYDNSQPAPQVSELEDDREESSDDAYVRIVINVHSSSTRAHAPLISLSMSTEWRRIQLELEMQIHHGVQTLNACSCSLSRNGADRVQKSM